MVTVQFPDPWLSPKHKKRRTVSAAMATACAEHLPQNGKVYISSDVPAVLSDGADTLAAAGLRRHCRPCPPGASDITSEEKGTRGSSATASDGTGVVVAPWTDEEGLLLASPVGGGRVFSERDVVCEDLWRKVYRVLLAKQ
jgi:tRNA G46 methylase TrmB